MTFADEAVLLAGIALSGVILTAAISLLIARRSTYFSTVTVERSKWIDKLRTNISQLIAQVHALDVELYKDDHFHGSKEYDIATKDIVATMAFIRLQLNPNGAIDANILSLLAAIQNHVGEQEYKNLEGVFVRHVQWLLKEEWEKVKYEARGVLGRLFAKYGAWRRKQAYARFCADEGSVSRWL
jgi:hypothetical protein